MADCRAAAQGASHGAGRAAPLPVVALVDRGACPPYLTLLAPGARPGVVPVRLPRTLPAAARSTAKA